MTGHLWGARTPVAIALAFCIALAAMPANAALPGTMAATGVLRDNQSGRHLQQLLRGLLGAHSQVESAHGTRRSRGQGAICTNQHLSEVDGFRSKAYVESIYAIGQVHSP